jgi:hypothetical protein
VTGEKSAEVILVAETSRPGERKSVREEVSQRDEGLNVKEFQNVTRNPARGIACNKWNRKKKQIKYMNLSSHFLTNRCIRDPYVQWCERLSLSGNRQGSLLDW